MAANNTSKFLPAIFQTDANKKFLNATLDQLTTEADLRRVNGYIGRKFAPTYKTTDNYVTEPTVERQNYQLEPSVVVQNKQEGTIDLFTTYIDLLNQIDVLGGNTLDHSRLFENESYTFDGLFDFDKFGNYNDYYWLPTGPETVQVYSGEVDAEETFVVSRNTGIGGYNFSGRGNGSNPVITLARGGTYKFNLSQLGNKFWIQTEPGISGTKALQQNISTRVVYGVQNNGASVGQLVFNVPTKTAQDLYTKMVQRASVDVATDYPYTEIQNKRLSTLLERYPDIFDGVITNLHKKTLAFIGRYADDLNWTTPSIETPIVDTLTSDYYVASDIVQTPERKGTWTIELYPTVDGDYLVVLIPATSVTTNERIFIKSGINYATREYFMERDSFYSPIPLITSALDRLYYQDATDPNLFGVIELVDNVDKDGNPYTIDVELNILGQKSYTSPNGIIFTNGMKVQFDSTVQQPEYADNVYYVEGVGKSIVLVPDSNLVTPEAYAAAGLVKPDYITINRNSIDNNAWSRSNRWFHIDVINASAAYNGLVAQPDQTLRAQRPIIEFEGNLQLFNSGRVSKQPIDVCVTSTAITDAMNQIEGATMGANVSVTIQGTTFTAGDRVVFTTDFDSSVRDNIYIVTRIDVTGQLVPPGDDANGLTDSKLHLILADDYVIEEGHCFVVTKGNNAGKTFYYNGTTWVSSQLKSGINQAPLFDLIDVSGVSIANLTNYPVSSFVGTRIFSYTQGTGTNDRVLEFPLSYRNFNSIGDIQFTNNFDTDIITYADGTNTVQLPANYNFLRQNVTLTEYNNKNIWVKNTEKTKQYQVFSYGYDESTNYFPVDVVQPEEEKTPYTKVFVNNKLISTDLYSYTNVGARATVRVDINLLTNGDKVDILVYSKTPSKTGYYEIPNSLNFNSTNATFGSLTLGQIRNHITTILENTKSAAEPSFTGLRDIEYKSNGGNIVQQAAPAMYSHVFLTDKTLNFSNSVDLASREYARFKNKFLELATKLDNVLTSNIPGAVDVILKNINSIKNKTFPWYYSDMVPYGDNANIITYTVLNQFQKQYEISQVFNDIALSNKSVLVYLNGEQLINGIDFYFPQDRSAIIINAVITLAVDDVIKIVEYYDTDGSFIPETPTKLGLYPKFTPLRFIDYSYVTPTEVIQGHDGSITPIFNDIRDNLLLELEKRIYNNIKIDYETHIFDLYDHLPGRFRTTDYTLKEFNQILSNSFLRWVGDIKVDYSTNTFFNSGNAWTWNYKKFKDRLDGSFLPGTWRAIYNHFFDTYRPNTHPWEMLGFGKQPSWWQARYGAAPYTGSNTLLWEDLEAGYIHAGTRAGIDTRFARPGLTKIIPVDDYGDLLSPEKWATSTFDSLKANSSYSLGDQGPVEFAWRTSSSFPYAIQQALALAKPGYYFGSLINIDRYYRDSTIDQLVNSTTHQRITPTTVVINGDTTDGTPVRSAGYLNWIRDYALSLGVDPTVKIRYYLENLSIQLGYKVGGYTDKKFIQVLAEQGSPTNTSNSIVVPLENYTVHLNASTPIKKIAYSAVTVQRTENGFTVNGYNQNNPYFTVIPSLANNNYYAITSLGRRALVFRDYQPVKVTIPYGYEFATTQEVVDFLISYGRHLTSQGFKFNVVDEALGETRNWILSAKEFLNWSQQGWKPGSIIILSPVYDTLINVQQAGVISQIDNTPVGTKILDQNSNFIKKTQFTESRLGNNFTLKSLNGETICLAELTVVQYEHVLLFDNVTVFNDILYVPELGNRQYRLKLIGSKTGSWTGAFDPPGFIYNNEIVDAWSPGVDYLMGSIVEYKNQYFTALINVPGASSFVQDKQWRQIDSNDIKTGLLPNFAYNASRLQQVYDVDNLPADTTYEGYGTSLIGFRKRPYLSNFGLDETSQVKFYQGFIKEKGTLNAITGLTNARTGDLSSDINIYEEWALRVGEYGALNSDQEIELILDEADITANPTAIEFLNKDDPDSQSGVVGYHPVDLYRAPADYKKNVFFNRNSVTNTINDIETAGYVNLTDVKNTLFDFGSYSSLDSALDKVGPGYYIWVAKDYVGEWNVYRVTETQINVTNMSYAADGLMTITLTENPALSIGDVFAVRSFDSRFNGFYQVYAITGLTSIQVVLSSTEPQSLSATAYKLETIKDLKSVNGYGVFYKLQPARIQNLTESVGIVPLNGWADGDKLWVDTADSDGNWAVYNKITAWTANTVIIDEAAISNANFGTTIASNKLANNFFVGQPDFVNIDGSTGTVKTFSRAYGEIAQTGKLSARANTSAGYGSSISVSDYTIVIGAPLSNGNEGYVFVYNLKTATTQAMRSNSAAAGDYFGNATAISGNNDWLYIGAPGENKVYSYYLKDVETRGNTIEYGVDTNLVLTGNVFLSANGVFNTANITLNSNIDNSRIQSSKLVTELSGSAVQAATYASYVDGTTLVLSQPLSGTATISLPGNLLTGTQTVMLGSANSYIAIGATVTAATGNAIPANTVVTAINGANLTLSNVANASVTSFVISSNTYPITVEIDSDSYRLSYTPDSEMSLALTDLDQNYINGLDFTLSGNVVTLIAIPTTSPNISISQHPYYAFSNTSISSNTGISSDRFGETIATTDDGKTVIIGAPGENNNSGAVYVYKAFEQAFISDRENSYLFNTPFTDLTKVYVDDILQDSSSYNVVDNSVKFINPLTLGRVVLIVSDQLVLVQKFVEPEQQEGALFGSQISMDHLTGASFFVGAPGKILSADKTGAVYRYTDTGKFLGSITASSNPEYTISSIKNGGSTFDSNIGIYINNYYVDLAGAVVTANVAYSPSIGAMDTWANVAIPAGYADPTTCVQLINNEKIPLVSATIGDSGFLTISSKSVLSQNKLDIRTNQSNLFDQIGITAYSLDQIIGHPEGSVGIGFAKNVKYSPDSNTLLVTSNADTIYYVTEIDTGITTFDQSSTRFIDTVSSTGSVYLYELLSTPNTGYTDTGTMGYIQHIKSDMLQTGDDFGYAADINKDLILIGAPGDDTRAVDSGAVYAYHNIGLAASWNPIRTQSSRVDLDNINKIFLYNANTQNIVATLDYIDPAKGKILGIAEQDIDFKTSIDPAIYNAGSDSGLAFSSGYHWNELQVGRIWWNLSTLRYIDYEQDDIVYRNGNWGKLFPGTTVKVCEWVESKYPPSQYIGNGGDGVPLYTNIYSVITKVIGGNVVQLYYFWVTNKENAAPNKTHSVKVLADIIENPQLQGIAYATVIKDNAIGLVNVQPYLNSRDIVLHIDYQKLYNQNTLHTEYELIKENDSTSTIPSRIINKLIDSLAGIDQSGQVVPDPLLTDANKIGIDIRPCQTLVLNRSLAVENFVKYVNGILLQHPIVYQYSLLGLEQQDPIPESTEYDKVVSTVDEIGYIDITLATGIPVGYKVLVTSDSTNSGLWTIYKLALINPRLADSDTNRQFETHRIQYYNTQLYWNKVDWYASDYDPTSRITYTVDSYKDIAALAIAEGEIIRVNYDNNAQFAIYRVNADLTLSKVGIQNGTIQLSGTLYNLPAGQMGWDEDRFDTVRFDQTPSIEIRNILIALRDDIFINSLGDQFNKLFFVMVNYILQEQSNVNWIFKSSFISIFHTLRELSQPPSYVLDNQDYYLQYIEEVKPYRTIVREYVVDYTSKDTVGNNVTDFDLPSLYNKTLGKYRPPSGELAIDSTLINITPEYQYWKQYHAFEVDSIEISSPGRNYLLEPVVTISGGGGSGATATAAIWGNGAIRSITLTNKGVGYTSRPLVTINGTGTGGLAAARITNKTVRQFDSKLKFDRIAYDSNVKIWSDSVSYSTGDIVAYNGEAYQALEDVAPATNFNFGSFTLLTGEDAGNANDRIISYIASRKRAELDLTTALGEAIASTQTNKFWLTQYIKGIEYPGVKVQGLLFNANVKDQSLLDSVIQSRYVDTGLGQRPEDIVIDGGAYIDYYSSHAPEELLPGILHESVDISVFTAEVVGQANTTVVSGGYSLAYREFLDINGERQYYRISGLATTFLIGELSPTDTVIYVKESSVLPEPDLVRAIPGVIFINGEKITYWENDLATNALRNIRRGVGGTSMQTHPSFSTVYDASQAQIVPDINPRTAIISSNSSFSSNSTINYWRANASTSIFTTVDNPTYKITLTANITANVGDYITQEFGNGNAVVRGTVENKKSIAVVFNSGSFTTANANCVLRVNGTVTSTVPVSSGILGNVSSAGTVTIQSTGSNVVIRQDSLAWLDSTLFIQGLQFQDAESLPARAFLGEGAAAVVLTFDNYYSTEDEVSVNSILSTENQQMIIKED
jgi:hypothetical protein